MDGYRSSKLFSWLAAGCWGCDSTSSAFSIEEHKLNISHNGDRLKVYLWSNELSYQQWLSFFGLLFFVRHLWLVHNV